MITYIYWFLLSVLALGLVMGLGNRFGAWKGGMAAAVLVLVVGTLAYFFYFEQMFVKRYGGTMTISNSAGHVHLGSTWKEDHLWVESWDPQTNECFFREYARSGLLEGSVVISECNPLPAHALMTAPQQQQQLLSPSSSPPQ